MIAKKNKLPIDEFPKDAKTVYRGNFFTIKAVHNNLPIYRIGVLCRSAIFKSAVLRNRLRRAVFRGLQPITNKKINDGQGLDLLIILNPPIINLTIKEIEKYINDIEFIQRII